VLFQRRVGKLIYSIIGLITSVVDCLRDILDVLVNLLLVTWRRIRVRADEVDKRLYALDEECCLIFKVILPTLVDVDYWYWLECTLKSSIPLSPAPLVPFMAPLCPSYPL